MSTYLAINLAIIAVPFMLTFLPAVRFYRQWPALLVTILLVSGFFIFWDALVTVRGDWAFNPVHVGHFKLFALPIEEWLFFLTVPYSCLFLYEGLARFFLDKMVRYNRWLYLLLAGLSLGAAWLIRDREYTLVVLLVLALVLLLGASVFGRLFSSRNFWLWSGAGLVLFVIFNNILTSLPVVTYSPAAIINVRIATIPIEDFFYNFSLLTLYLGTYLWVKKNLPKK